MESRPADPVQAEWTDPGYFSGRSRMLDGLRLMLQLIFPPRGHRTLPTRTGAALIAVTIGVGTAAFNTGQNILYLALALMLSSLLVSGLLSWFNFKGCRWRFEPGRHFRAGEISPVCLRVHNSKTWLPTYALSFKLAARRSDAVRILHLPERLDAGSSVRLQWEFMPTMRGEEVLILERMESAYPFGFLNKSIKESHAVGVRVWPARCRYRMDTSRAGKWRFHGSLRRRGEGVELLHLRPYRHGDPLRSVHWKASARMGSLLVRETAHEQQASFTLFVDPSPTLWSAPAFERMCSFVATLAEDLFAREQLQAVWIRGCPSIAVRQRGDLEAVMDCLATLQPVALQAADGPSAAPPGAIEFVPGCNRADHVMVRIDGEVCGES